MSMSMSMSMSIPSLDKLSSLETTVYSVKLGAHIAALCNEVIALMKEGLLSTDFMHWVCEIQQSVRIPTHGTVEMTVYNFTDAERTRMIVRRSFVLRLVLAMKSCQSLLDERLSMHDKPLLAQTRVKILKKLSDNNVSRKDMAKIIAYSVDRLTMHDLTESETMLYTLASRVEGYLVRLDQLLE
jgi:hypothetical protein